MTIDEMRARLDALGVNWLGLCPDKVNEEYDYNVCPDGLGDMDTEEGCPQCWMKYGNLDKEAAP